MKICSEYGCTRPYSAKGLCKKHYERQAYLAQREMRKARARARYKEKREEILTAHRLAVHGMTDDEYFRRLEEQGHGCAICGEGPRGRKQRLCVDHCHASGRIRGLLCDACNRGIGLLGDDLTRLAKAIDYIKRSSVEPQTP